MAVKIAEKIIGEELRSSPETIVSIARECLRGVRHEHSLTLRINPGQTDRAAAQSGFADRDSRTGPPHSGSSGYRSGSGRLRCR